jgi:hypothetical protein
MVRVYFPMNNHGDKKLAPIDRIVVDDFSNSLLPFLNPYLTQDQKTKFNQDLVQFQSTQTNSYNFNQTNLNSTNVPFSRKNKLPVIFFSPGMGSVFQDYGNLISKLVSRGYFVVGINFTFVANPGQAAHEIIFPSNDPTKPMIVPYINGTSYNSQTDIKKINKDNENSLTVALLGHSGGANYCVAVTQDQNMVKKYNLKAVGSLDTGYGLFTKADAVDSATGMLLPPIDWRYPAVSANVPFMHLHSSTQNYGA